MGVDAGGSGGAGRRDYTTDGADRSGGIRGWRTTPGPW
jgi:hypothetical protein